MVEGNTLARIYEAHRRGLFLLALSITGSAADAEDAVHDAFARMCRPSRPDGDGVAYAFAAVQNAAIDRLRRRRPDQEADVFLMPCVDGSNDPIVGRERDHAIAAAVDTLPIDLRTVVCLRIFSELTFRQIGELVGAPLQTVASRYEAALRKLEPQLRK